MICDIILELKRTLELDTCLFGSIQIGANRFYTLELPWRDNKRGESCIPIGAYTCRRVCSPKFGETFKICDVPDRSNILFHAGNRANQTRGCVLIGESTNSAEEAICDSKKAFQRFMKCLEGVEEFRLIVR